MKKAFLFSLLLVSMSVHAQNYNALKDSLLKAADVLAYHPDSIDLRLKKASWNIELQQWNYAKDEYDVVLKLNPKNIAGLYYRAFVNEKLKRYNFARLDYENLLTLVPGNFEVQLGLALLNQKDQHYTEALDQINSLVTQYPDSAVAYAARGGIEKERGMLELAEYDYSEAIKRDAGNTDYRMNRVDILLTLGKNEEAKSALDDIVKLGVPRANLIEFYRRIPK
ncbi:MAG: hypothetical protein LKG25_02305 [Prevotella sp.]|jgi:tetratricopeptide (TPR) repeat protein|nr:hypothetical protein [Prevotella sp.]MCI1281413.1 hypothetical protein [Prevotella sp.]